MRTEERSTALGALLERELVAVPEAVGGVRRLVGAALKEGLRGGLVADEARLCVSEMLTNVITHVGPGTPVTLRVSALADGRARLELTDPDPGSWPVPRQPADEEESGRGLTLLGALAERWGVDHEPDRKTVWCELGPPARHLT